MFGKKDKAPKTRHKHAEKTWNERMRFPQLQIQRWQKIAGVLALLLAVSTLANVTQALSSKVQPYVVEVHESGQVRLVGKPEPAQYEPSEAAEKFFVQELVTNLRSRPRDPVVLRKNLEHASALLTENGRNLMEKYIERVQPHSKENKRLVSVDIESIVRESEKTYQVAWTEHYAGKFQGPSIAKYTGLFTVHQGQPHDEAELRKNPLGLYVDHFSWSRRQ
jgi:type IV secretion system protein VirB5